MIIGEAPDHVEIRKGHPFVGKTGGTVSLFLRRMNLERSKVYLTTALKCMLPDSRKPTDAELHHCQGWLDAEIRKQNPKLILVMGKSAARTLIRRKDIESLRGKEWFYKSVPVIVTYHPIMYMRRSEKRHAIMNDIDSVRRKLNRLRLEKQGNYSENEWMLG
jgi:DNA polymerase